MTEQRRHATLLAGLLLMFAVAMGAGSAKADTETDPGWQLRGSFAGINFNRPDGGGGHLCSGGYLCGGYRTSIDVGGGVGVNGEYRFTRRLGLDLGMIVGGGVDIQQSLVYFPGGYTWVHDTLTFTALTAGMDIHLTPARRADLYVAPLVALVQYGGLEMYAALGHVVTRLDVDDDWAWGVTIGLGVPFGTERRWSFQAGFTYFDTAIEGSNQVGRIESGYDVTIYAVGFGYRF